TLSAFRSSQNEHLEQALWSAIRLIEEKATLYRQLAARRAAQGHEPIAAEYRDRAAGLDREGEAVRRLILTGLSAKEPSVAAEFLDPEAFDRPNGGRGGESEEAAANITAS